MTEQSVTSGDDNAIDTGTGVNNTSENQTNQEERNFTQADVDKIVQARLEKYKKRFSDIDLNEYKRNQAAPGLKITPLAFGVGRRMPIVQKYKN